MSDPIVISGVFSDPNGVPVSGAKLVISSQVNTSDTFKKLSVSVATASDGTYSFSLLPGGYNVVVLYPEGNRVVLGEFNLQDGSPAGSLNDYLLFGEPILADPVIYSDIKKIHGDVLISSALSQTSADSAQQSVQDAGQQVTLAAEQVALAADQVGLATQQADSAAGSATQTAADVVTTGQNVVTAQQAVTDATAAKNDTVAAADSVAGLGNAYPTMELAQAAITAGTIPNNGLFSVISTDNSQTYAIWQNISGTPTAVLDSTGAQKTYPSGAAVESVQVNLLSVSRFLPDSNRVGGFISNPTDKESPLNFDSKGKTYLGADDESLNDFKTETKSLTQSIPGLVTSVDNLSEQSGLFSDRRRVGGIVDNLGSKLSPLNFDRYGRLYLGNDDVSINENMQTVINGLNGLTSLNKELYGNTTTVSCFGDSLTQGAGTGTPANGWVEQIRVLMPALTFRKFGVGGQVASEIACRQGGFVNQLTIANNTIPATGAVDITAQTYRPITVNSGGALLASIPGTLAGVHGVVTATYDSNGNMLTNTFTRTTAGSATYVDPATPFFQDSNDSEYDIQSLECGRNDVYAADFTDRVMSALDAMVSYIKPKNKRIIIPSITNRTGTTEIIGTTAYNNIISANALIKKTYPLYYCEVRNPIVRSYNPDIPQDVIDFNNDCPPSSLMFDDTHFLPAGYAIWAQTYVDFFNQRGWV